MTTTNHLIKDKYFNHRLRDIIDLTNIFTIKKNYSISLPKYSNYCVSDTIVYILRTYYNNNDYYLNLLSNTGKFIYTHQFTTIRNNILKHYNILDMEDESYKINKKTFMNTNICNYINTIEKYLLLEVMAL